MRYFFTQQALILSLLNNTNIMKIISSTLNSENVSSVGPAAFFSEGVNGKCTDYKYWKC